MNKILFIIKTRKVEADEVTYQMVIFGSPIDIGQFYVYVDTAWGTSPHQRRTPTAGNCRHRDWGYSCEPNQLLQIRSSMP